MDDDTSEQGENQEPSATSHTGRRIMKAAAQGALAGGAAGALGGPGGIGVGVGVGVVVATGNELLEMAVEKYKTADDRLIVKRDQETARDLECNSENLSRKVDELREGAKVENIATVLLTRLHAYERARRTCADDKKARLIMAAFMKSLDPDEYERGMSVRVLEILEHIDAPEVELLVRFERIVEGNKPIRLHRGSMDRYLAKRLIDHDLLIFAGMTAEKFMLEKSVVRHPVITDLAKRVLEHVRAGLPAEEEE